MKRISIVALALALATPMAATAANSPDFSGEPQTRTRGGNQKKAGTITVTGTLTDEGVTCQALRGDDGQLYTIGGDLGKFTTGDRVTVTGTVAEVSICQQGTTIDVQKIKKAK